MEVTMNGLTQEELGKSVKETRLAKGWTQQQEADKVGISRSLLARYVSCRLIRTFTSDSNSNDCQQYKRCLSTPLTTNVWRLFNQVLK
ncbi:helix-turn-helix domain-containing protein [Enterococcus faecalis]|uniref:helix-turn-helix domain-containing protein n=1 Tax=Enterococcus faecalis TaxID=1351 RepID=UPI003F8CF3C3